MFCSVGKIRVLAMLLFVVSHFILHAAERINHEGRILGTTPVVTNAILFNTPESDAVMSTLQIFPRDNGWNEDISRRPVLANSPAMLQLIITNLASAGAGRTNLRAFQEMNFVLVPDNQPLRPMNLVTYSNQSEPPPYPIPTNMPVEGWPTETAGLTLYDWQRNVNNESADRHSIIIQPGSGGVWETWQTKLNVTATTSNWQAANGARWNLTNNTLRPLGWTSADAAGLSMLGGLVRYDECQRGMVEHAVRLIVRSTRASYLYPATHHASVPSTTNPDKPAMGERLRLKASFNIPTNWSVAEQAVARALKKYGAIVADNGGFFSFSVVPDSRWPSNPFQNLQSLNIGNFEVIQTTTENQGPRTPGAPLVNAGADQTASVGEVVSLNGSVLYTNATPLTARWFLYSGPTNAAFANAALTNTTVTFNATGTYTLLLSASNGLHTTAYDAKVVTVVNGIRAGINRTGTNVVLRWAGGTAPFTVEALNSLNFTNWTSLATGLNTNTFNIPMTNAARFYRVRGQ